VQDLEDFKKSNADSTEEQKKAGDAKGWSFRLSFLMARS
jgi:hypothetical protein